MSEKKKRNRKKTAVIVVCAALAVLIAGGAVGWSFLPHPLNYPINKIAPVGSGVSVIGDDVDEVTIKKDAPGDFKVLMFTDMHLDGKNETSYETVDRLVKNIQSEKPDLVILGGDNVTSALNRVRAKQLGRIFEKLGVYWAGVIGNHEGDNAWSIKRSEMVDIFASFDHCLMRRGRDDVEGDCNYCLNVVGSDGENIQTFFFLDSYDEVSEAQIEEYGIAEEDVGYDGPHPDQIKWYSEKAAALKAADPDLKSILVTHIPLPEYAAAAEKGDFLYGVNMEDPCCTCYDNGLFAAVKATGSTTAVFCGHDHLNSFGAMYDGVLLSYIQPSGYGSYNLGRRGEPREKWLQGYTRLTLSSGGAYDIKSFRNSELDGLSA